MSRTIADLTAGTLIYIDETVSGATTHTPYIYLGIDENGKARVLRQYFALGKSFHSSNVASYSGTTLDSFLENETTGFLSRLDSDTINALSYTTIKYIDYNINADNSAAIAEISRRCFLLSWTEMGYTQKAVGSEGQSYITALKNFTGATTAADARIAYYEGQTSPNYYWLRSARNTTQFVLVQPNGGDNGSNCTSQYAVRPALSFVASTPVSDEGAESVFLLPTGRVTTWNVDMKMKVGESAGRPSKARVDLPTSGISSTTIQVTNNYGDTSPTWVTVQNGSSVNLSNTTKTTTNWEVGVKIQASASTPSGYIGEPVVLISAQSLDA